MSGFFNSSLSSQTINDSIKQQLVNENIFPWLQTITFDNLTIRNMKIPESQIILGSITLG